MVISFVVAFTQIAVKIALHRQGDSWARYLLFVVVLEVRNGETRFESEVLKMCIRDSLYTH